METVKIKNTGKLTLKRLKEFSVGNIIQDIEFAKDFYPPYPDTPKKPFLEHGATSGEAKQYAIDLEQYEQKMAVYKKEKEACLVGQGEIDAIIEDYIKGVSGFNNLPEKVKPKVWHKAWQDGHSEGYHSIYYELVELVELFN